MIEVKIHGKKVPVTIEDLMLGRLDELVAAEVLHIDYENDLTDLNFLVKMRNLEEVSITRCMAIGDLSPLAYLKKLKRLTLAASGAVTITDFSPISELVYLESLDLSNHQFLISVASVAPLLHLSYLNLNFCTHLEDLRAIEHLPHLESLHIQDCKLLEADLPKLLQRHFISFTPP